MARRIVHYYAGDTSTASYTTDTILCGSTYAWRSRTSRSPAEVTCQRCKAGLIRRGLLPRPPRPTMDADIVVGGARGPVVRPQPRTEARPDPDDVDNYNNSLLRLGIIGR